MNTINLMANDVPAVVRQVLVGILGGRAEDYQEHHTLIEDLSMDSLELLDLAMVLEDRFGIELEADDVLKLQTVGDLVTLVKTHLS